MTITFGRLSRDVCPSPGTVREMVTSQSLCARAVEFLYAVAALATEWLTSAIFQVFGRRRIAPSTCVREDLDALRVDEACICECFHRSPE